MLYHLHEKSYHNRCYHPHADHNLHFLRRHAFHALTKLASIFSLLCVLVLLWVSLLEVVYFVGLYLFVCVCIYTYILLLGMCAVYSCH